MVSFERKVGPKGQVVIPKEIRKNLGISPSMNLFLTVSDHKIMITRTKTGIAEMLREWVKKDGRRLKKIDADKMYEREIKEKWKERV